jgi:hypothetical protein
MSTADTVAALTEFAGRGAGTDAERRAAGWLSSQLEAAGRSSTLEPFWCRPNWALAHMWHVLLGVAGSLVSVQSARVGGALVLVALISVIADGVTGHSPGRLLSPERASQNVVSESAADEQRVRLIITANYDAGRNGIAYRDALRRPFARLNATLGALGPGWLGWLVIAMLWLLITAIARLGGSGGTGIGAVQLVPTIGLVLALALLADLASSGYAPAANDNASGVAVALALVRALDAGPPLNTVPELVLTGAGDGDGIGLRRYLERRKFLNPSNAVVIGIAPSGAGTVRWFSSDGRLLPQRYFGRLVELAEQIARDEPHFEATPHRGRGSSPAQRARGRGLPAISIGCLDQDGAAPRSHQSQDTPEHVAEQAMDDAVQFGLMLVDAIDAFIGRLPRPEPKPSRRPLSLRRA